MAEFDLSIALELGFAVAELGGVWYALWSNIRYRASGYEEQWIEIKNHRLSSRLPERAWSGP